MSTKKKKYFKSNGEGVSAPACGFLLKWYDGVNCVVKCDGPFSNKKDADELLRTYLKNGVCSWLVEYDD